MTTEWISDSCLCVIEFENGTFVFVNWKQRCREHGALDNQALLDAAFLTNTLINDQLNLTGNETPAERRTEVTRISDLRAAEKDRIRRLGPPDTR